MGCAADLIADGNKGCGALGRVWQTSGGVLAPSDRGGAWPPAFFVSMHGYWPRGPRAARLVAVLDLKCFPGARCCCVSSCVSLVTRPFA